MKEHITKKIKEIALSVFPDNEPDRLDIQEMKRRVLESQIIMLCAEVDYEAYLAGFDKATETAKETIKEMVIN